MGNYVCDRPGQLGACLGRPWAMRCLARTKHLIAQLPRAGRSRHPMAQADQAPHCPGLPGGPGQLGRCQFLPFRAIFGIDFRVAPGGDRPQQGGPMGAGARLTATLCPGRGSGPRALGLPPIGPQSLLFWPRSCFRGCGFLRMFVYGNPRVIEVSRQCWISRVSCSSLCARVVSHFCCSMPLVIAIEVVAFVLQPI